jgi:hypothetical protein
MTRLHADFSHSLGAHWQTCAMGGGRLERTGSGLRLVNTTATASHYSNAQIDDYRGLPRRDFLWSPPLTLSVRARFSHPGATPTDPQHRTSSVRHSESVLQPKSTAERPIPNARTPFVQPTPVQSRELYSGPRSFTSDSGQSGWGARPVQDGNGENNVETRNLEASTLLGTAGFGFWNDPFMLTEKRLPALPRAIWFFYASPPSDMKLDLSTRGWGWKAATIDADRPSFWLLAPTIPIAVPLMHVDAAHRRLWPIAQRTIGVSEAPVDVDMTAWHTYVVEWGVRTARFLVDGQVILACATPPQGPLGLVIWLDNQYMIVTPQGRLRHGLLDKPGQQWLELAAVTVS